jgi:hypothetical protein
MKTQSKSHIDTIYVVEVFMAKKKQNKAAKKKNTKMLNIRDCLTVITELCGIAGFLLTLYNLFKKEK